MSKFAFSTFPTIVLHIRSHDWDSCTKPPKHLRVNYKGAKWWPVSFCSSVFLGFFWVSRRGAWTAVWIVSPSELLGMLIPKGESDSEVRWGGAAFRPQIFLCLHGKQSSVLGGQGLESRSSPALLVNQHLSSNLLSRTCSASKSGCQHFLVNSDMIYLSLNISKTTVRVTMII